MTEPNAGNGACQALDSQGRNRLESPARIVHRPTVTGGKPMKRKPKTPDSLAFSVEGQNAAMRGLPFLARIFVTGVAGVFHRAGVAGIFRCTGVAGITAAHPHAHAGASGQNCRREEDASEVSQGSHSGSPWLVVFDIHRSVFDEKKRSLSSFRTRLPEEMRKPPQSPPPVSLSGVPGSAEDSDKLGVALTAVLSS